MPMPISNSFAWMVRFVIVVAVFGVITGAALSGTDLFNFNTSAAEARAVDQQTDQQAQIAAIDLGHYQTIQDAEAQAAQERIRMQTEAQQREIDQQLRLRGEQSTQDHQQALALRQAQADQDMALTRLTHYAVSAVGAVVALIVSIGCAALLAQWGRSRLLLAKAQTAHSDPWRDREWRKEQIRQAREMETQYREALQPQSSGNGRKSNGNGTASSKAVTGTASRME